MFPLRMAVRASVALAAVGATGQAGTTPLWLHLLVLAVVTVACCVLALRRLARSG